MKRPPDSHYCSYYATHQVYQLGGGDLPDGSMHLHQSLYRGAKTADDVVATHRDLDAC
ncbi:hypothetical protein DPMN_045740 [Dreissena polymorpha]|uniref:Uncharacterized protein n=1 Tax=Dreissena polymorpha TaxID=45954 RepID=A0A9D4D4X3_DREPO|nr:hypothetical protein DPMN_045740 [Dreissena polymorpha]